MAMPFRSPELMKFHAVTPPPVRIVARLSGIQIRADITHCANCCIRLVCLDRPLFQNANRRRKNLLGTYRVVHGSSKRIFRNLRTIKTLWGTICILNFKDFDNSFGNLYTSFLVGQDKDEKDLKRLNILIIFLLHLWYFFGSSFNKIKLLLFLK